MKMDNFWGKKNDDNLAVVENDCNQTINIKKKKSICDDKSKWITMDNETVIFDGSEYICMKCRFSTKNLKDFRRHLNTKKHKKKPQKKPLTINKKKFICLCGKKYKFRSGLSKHKLKCEKYIENGKKKKKAKKMEKNDNSRDSFVQKIEKNEFFYKKKIILEKNVTDSMYSKDENTHVYKLNDICIQSTSVTKGDLEKIMEQTFTQNNNITKLLEQNAVLIEKMSTMKNATNISYQNCGNKKMTINVYLNEKCKDAMNLSDFVNNLPISLDDLLYTQQHGYAEGISNIFVKHLQDLTPHKRPIHCCNKKSMQFYVRDENKWLKDKENKKIDKSIQDLTVKQIKHLKEWEVKNPNYLKDEKLLSQWQQLVHEIMGPSDDNTREKDKEMIIKKLGKTVKFKENLIIKDIKI
jgi:hypothetical protein|uniref:C2H2-type domain-containing protein n=1 Tax=viral metagenome TaxID=1070528 RepID=A0A6C0LZT1_9ZZZZ